MNGLFQNPLINAFFALPGSMLFAMSLRAPKRSVLLAGIGGLMGQLIYVGLCRITSIYMAVFVATLVTGLLAEAGSRAVKTPATVICIPAIMPLVPGIMLYRAMLAFSQNQLQKGANELISALIYTGCMAVAITGATIAGKRFITPLYNRIVLKRRSK